MRHLSPAIFFIFCSFWFTLGSGIGFAYEKPVSGEQTLVRDYLQRPPEDEVVYFMLPDRFENGDESNDQGGYSGGPLQHGFNPTHKGFYQGGDLIGLTKQLDYIQGLGATAIWLGPIYKNKPVQGSPGQESAGYHGYWITDFHSVDPHLGSNEDLKKFVEAAHARGIKIYLDIITNHTADVIAYRECHDPDYKGADRLKNGCPYRSKADYPYSRYKGVEGEAINPGFKGDTKQYQTKSNFAKLTRPDYAYTPFLSEAEKNIKKPAWLNEMRYYHNRGETSWAGENSRYGDFAGLDDLFTEDPFVVDGFIEIFKWWISEFKIDGFRIDTAKHVNLEFWQAFLPAVIEHAHAEGIPHFYVFGEVYDPDPAGLATYTHIDEFPLVLDFAFQSAVYDVVAKGEAPNRFRKLFRADHLYKGGTEAAGRLPTFIGNHDMGRFAYFLRRENPKMKLDEVMERVKMAHALLFFLRGVPVIYYGAEQGFIGDGWDQDARETMFATDVKSYADNKLLGTEKKSTQRNFDRDHPLYKSLSSFAGIYHAHETLRRGEQKLRRADLEGEGKILAVSRLGEGWDYLVVFNTDNAAVTANVEVPVGALDWESVLGNCAAKSIAPGSYQLALRPLETKICRTHR